MDLPFYWKGWRQNDASNREQHTCIMHGICASRKSWTGSEVMPPQTPFASKKIHKTEESSKCGRQWRIDLVHKKHIDRLQHDLLWFFLSFILFFFIRFLCVSLHNEHIKSMIKSIHFALFWCSIRNRRSMERMHIWFTCEEHFDAMFIVYLQRNEMGIEWS